MCGLTTYQTTQTGPSDINLRCPGSSACTSSADSKCHGHAELLQGSRVQVARALFVFKRSLGE